MIKLLISLLLSVLGAQWVAQVQRLYGQGTSGGHASPPPLFIAEDDPHPYRVAMPGINGLVWIAVADTAPQAADWLREAAEAFKACGWEVISEGELAARLIQRIPNGLIMTRLEVVYMPEIALGRHLPAFIRQQMAVSVRNEC
jgi:hypothetical protein